MNIPLSLSLRSSLLNIGRPWVDRYFSLRIQIPDDAEIFRNDFRKLPGMLHQLNNAILRLTGFLSHAVIQPVDSAAGMGIDNGERLVLFPYIGYYGAQDEMFEDIGAVSGMEAVSVAEHMVT